LAPNLAPNYAEQPVSRRTRRGQDSQKAYNFLLNGTGESFATACQSGHYLCWMPIVDGLKARGQPVKASAVHAITTKDFPTKAVRPANSRLDLSRPVTTPPWQQALRRELDILVQRSPRSRPL